MIALALVFPEALISKMDQNDIQAVPLVVGDVFPTTDQLLARAFEFSCRSGLTYRIHRCDKTRLTLKCSVDSCRWVVKSKRVEGEMMILSIGEHQCSAGEHRACDGIAEWVSQKLRTKVEGCYDYGPKQAQKDLLAFREVAINIKTVTRGLELARDLVHGKQDEVYALVAPYLADLQSVNPDMVFHTERRDDNAFSRCFWSFLTPENLDTLLPICCSDACSLTGPYAGLLFLTAGLDGDRQVVPLSFSIGPSEDQEGWQYHHSHTRDHFGAHLRRFSLFSDRQKGLESDNTLDGVIAHHGLCTKHLVGNVSTETCLTTGQASDVIWVLAKCQEKATAEALLNDVKEQFGQEAENYIRSTGLERWCDAFWPEGLPRFQTYTSNIAECMNSIFKEPRQGSIITILRRIREWWTDKMAERRTQHAALPVGGALPAIGLRIDGMVSKANLCTIVSLEGEGENAVYEIRRDGQGWVVKIGGVENLYSCNCPVFARYGHPCQHVIRTLMHLSIDIKTGALPHCYSILGYRKLYRPALYPSRTPLGALQADGTLPPEVRKGVGRKKKLRIRSKGEVREITCRKCLQKGHNKRGCKNTTAGAAKPAPKVAAKKSSAKPAPKVAAKKSSAKPAPKVAAKKSSAKPAKRRKRKYSSSSTSSLTSSSSSSSSSYS